LLECDSLLLTAAGLSIIVVIGRLVVVGLLVLVIGVLFGVLVV